MRDNLSRHAPDAAVSDADKARALHGLGVFYLREGFAAQGVALLRAASRFAPDTPELQRALAVGLLEAGEAEDALTLIDEIGPTLTDTALLATARHLRARALLDLGRTEAAEASWRAAQKAGGRG
jgi:tetratricopeptide (TPR) repeat protein